LEKGSKSDGVFGFVSVLCDEKYGKVIWDCVQTSVTIVVVVFLDKTVDVNTYDEIFAGMTNLKHHKSEPRFRF